MLQVFKQQIQKLELAGPEEVDAIFSNISDIVELTITLIGSLEDTLEMAEEGQVRTRRSFNLGFRSGSGRIRIVLGIPDPDHYLDTDPITNSNTEDQP